MFTRLIWKELRMFWPIWLCVAVVAVSLQWLVFDQIYDNSGKVGERLMVVFAWASLYACVVGSASFASEREGNTLGFLDALGLGRGRLWSAKVAFSAATSLLLVLVIAVLIVPSASLSGTNGTGDRLLYLVAYGLALMFSTLFWSLFWSSWKVSPLTAAVLTIFSVLLMVLAVPLRMLDQMPDAQLMPIIQVGLGIASAAFVGSFLVITRGQPTPRIPRVRVRLESPPRETSARPGTTYRLIWICLRENRMIWLGGLAPLVLLGFVRANGSLASDDIGIVGVLSFLAAMLAGVNLFGAENRRGRRRFLASHGARPSAIWFSRILTALAVFGTAGSYAIGGSIFTLGPATSPMNVGIFWILFVNGFAVAQLMGMLCDRAITAVAFTLMGGVVVIGPQLFLDLIGVLEPWQHAAMPLGLLGLSWAWRSDWLLERPGAGKWIKLGSLSALGVLAMVVGLMLGRAYGLPNLDAYAADLQLAAVPPVPANQDARPLYRQAVERYKRLADFEDPERGNVESTLRSLRDEVIEHGWTDEAKGLKPWLDANAGVLALLRQAGSKAAVGVPADQGYNTRKDLLGTLDMERAQDVARLLAAQARERQAKKDAAGAWDSLATSLKFSRYLQTRTDLQTCTMGIRLEIAASRLAIAWALKPGPSEADLGRARSALRALGGAPPIADAIRAEAAEASRLAGLPTPQLDAMLGEVNSGQRPSGMPYGRIALAFVGLPTERERVRRGAQAEFLAQLMLASHRPSQLRELDRLSEWHYLKAGLPQATIEIGRLRMMLKNTPLLRLLPSADQVVRLAAEREATRRALDIALGLGSWKLKHGSYPDSLAELTTLPGVGTLPDDPFSERPFFYGPDNSSGDPAGMGGMAGMMSSAPPEPLAPNPTQDRGRRVLVSVGFDGRFGHDDLVFVLP